MAILLIMMKVILETIIIIINCVTLKLSVKSFSLYPKTNKDCEKYCDDKEAWFLFLTSIEDTNVYHLLRKSVILSSSLHVKRKEKSEKERTIVWNIKPCSFEQQVSWDLVSFWLLHPHIYPWPAKIISSEIIWNHRHNNHSINCIPTFILGLRG